jgi:endoglucanase
MSRRNFLRIMAHGGLGLATGLAPLALAKAEADGKLPEPTPEALPRWRGFNLLEKFMVANQRPFREEDFAWIAELGFDFVRLPLDYRCWIEQGDWTRLREGSLREIDEAVRYGEKHGVHVQINFHRAPGFTVASPPEPRDLWTDREAQDVCARHWGHFARRYQGVPSSRLSFNPFNEPSKVGAEAHRAVVERVAGAIRERDKDRLIVCDGRDYATTPPAELVGLGVAAATRGYAPFRLTHYRASWVEGSDRWEPPTYPMREGEKVWDREALERDQIGPWKRLQGRGVGVMVGEFGAHNRTPHAVVLPWMRDCLSAWKEAGWGWALWNFRGSFGVLDSERSDVAYEDWRGHKLDRAMLELLRSS